MKGEMLEHLSEKQLGSKIKSGNSLTIRISNIPVHAWTVDQLVQDLRAGQEMLELYTSFITKRAQNRWNARNV